MKDNIQPKILLYFFPVVSTFIKKDINLLSRHYRVLTKGLTDNKSRLPVYLFRQFLFLIAHVFRSDLLICRFAGYHSVLPVVFGILTGRKVLIVLGGTECHKFPSINYGAQLRGLYRHAINFSMRNATILLPVHESLIECNYDYDEVGAPKQGCKVFCQRLNTPFRTIYNGYDEKVFYYTGVGRVKNSFITVASNFNGAEYYRKGADLIVEVARLLPECHFTIIGNKKDPIKNLPKNISIIPAVPNEQLKDHFSRAEFYLQLSLAEGFPNALCEAMLCGCIPIGANTFGIPDIIADTGFLLKKKSHMGLKIILDSALKSDKNKLSNKAIDRIRTKYPIQRRETEFSKLIHDLTT
jgi:glycosyltransferase involved in cell wall biosynthesis